MSKKDETPIYIKTYERDKYDLIHKIIFNSEMEKWDLVEKYSKLYHEIYGPFVVDEKYKLNVLEPVFPLFLGRSK